MLDSLQQSLSCQTLSIAFSTSLVTIVVAVFRFFFLHGLGDNVNNTLGVAEFPEVLLLRVKKIPFLKV